MITSAEFLLPGGPVGVLLIHGLTGTPAEMRMVGKGLHSEGFTVYGMQLAGHCGDEADLLATGWRDWVASVNAAADRLRERCSHVFVGGLSMGALLALKLAADRPDDVAGVAAYGGTFRYDGWAIPKIARLAFLLPTLCKLGIGRNRSFQESYPYGIKDDRVRDRIAGAMIGGDSAAAGLPGNPWPSLAEFYLLARLVERELSRVKAPCLVMHAVDDDIASLANARLIERSVRGPVETVLLENSYHMITVDQERKTVIARSADFFERVLQTRGVRWPLAAAA